MDLVDFREAQRTLVELGVGYDAGECGDYELVDEIGLWPHGGAMPQGCDRIVVHHQAGGMKTKALIDWQSRTRSGSYHEYIEESKVTRLLEPTWHAWHIHDAGAERAGWYGIETDDPKLDAHKRRGDFGGYGIVMINEADSEAEDTAGKWLVPDEVILTAMWRISDLWLNPPNGLSSWAPVFTHFDFDPANKPWDPVRSVTAGMLSTGAAALTVARTRFPGARRPTAVEEVPNVASLIVAGLRSAADTLEGA